MELRRATQEVNHQSQEGEMDTAQPSPGAEWGLPVIAHSPGHKQQAVACVIQPEEGPACLPGDGGRREGKGPSRQKQDSQQGQKSRSPLVPALKAISLQAQTCESGYNWTALTEAHGGWILCDLGMWLSDECLPRHVALSSASLSSQHLGN